MVVVEVVEVELEFMVEVEVEVMVVKEELVSFAFDRDNLPDLVTEVYHFLSNSGDVIGNLLGMNRLLAKDFLCAGRNW